jgi:hypothetical protein
MDFWGIVLLLEVWELIGMTSFWYQLSDQSVTYQSQDSGGMVISAILLRFISRKFGLSLHPTAAGGWYIVSTPFLSNRMKLSVIGGFFNRLSKTRLGVGSTEASLSVHRILQLSLLPSQASGPLF